MKHKQNSVLDVEIEGKSYQLFCDSDSPLGSLHDALMQMKGWCVERMVAAQKEEQAIADQQKEQVE
jgi:hypothetical protein